MDSGPFSTPQPADRRVVSRPEQAYRPKEPQQPAEEPVRPAHRPAVTPRGGKQKRSFKRIIIPIAIILVLALAGVGGWLLWSRSQNMDSAINKDEYQAVFLTNGQVYLGKLASYNSTYFQLTDAFIVATPTTAKPATTAADASANSNDTQLVKITSGVLAPHDAMFVVRSQVLYYENLQPNGKAAKLIKQYNGQ